MTSYLTQPFSDMTTPMYDAFTKWQADVNANTEAAASAIAAARYAQQASYGVDVVQPWKLAQMEIAQSEIAWKQAAMIAVKTAIDLVMADKIDQRNRAIAADQRDLADRQIKMGEELHARYIGKFAPLEDGAADFSKYDWENNRYKPQYAMHQGRAKLDAARAYGKVVGKLPRKFARYCTGANANMIRLTHSDWAKMETDMVNRAWRNEEAQMWRRDDVQWARMQNAIANGQRLPSQAAADMAAGVRGAVDSNAIKAASSAGWYGAIARGADGLFQFGYSTLEQQKALSYSAYPQMARGGMQSYSNGSMGASGITNSGWNSVSQSFGDGGPQTFALDDGGGSDITSGLGFDVYNDGY